MALPTSFDFIFVPGSVVPSAFLNDVQTQIIALHTSSLDVATKRDKSRTLMLGAQDFIPDSLANWSQDDSEGGAGSSGWLNWKRTLATGSNAYATANIPLDVGDYVVSYKIWLKETNVSDDTHRSRATWQRVLMASGQSAEEVDDPRLVLSAGSGLGASISDVIDAPSFGLAVDQRMQLLLTTYSSGVEIWGATIVIDHA